MIQVSDTCLRNFKGDICWLCGNFCKTNRLNTGLWLVLEVLTKSGYIYMQL